MIAVNLDKVKGICHAMRREARANEFAPLDQQVMIALGDPVRLAEAEAARQVVRDKYALMQQDINAASSINVLQSILDGI